MSLMCKIFGHKFWWESTSRTEKGLSVRRAVIRNDVENCERCGLSRSTVERTHVNREIAKNAKIRKAVN